MDAACIDMQILSLTSPGAEQLEAAEASAFARETNGYLADALRSHPTRFGAFATLPTADPNAAAAELDRAINDYGFKGELINGHIQGRYLDDKCFWPIFEHAEALKVPIYLHPTQPPYAVIEASCGGFTPTRSWPP
jgi:predicted TIM-barrel fold metal-dependent hydrolase